MRVVTLVVCLCLVLAGCVGGSETTTSGPGETTVQTTPRGTTTATATTSSSVGETRFDGDANTHVSVRNPTNETWNVTYRIERNGTVVFDGVRSVEPGNVWRITTLERPGNYTFTVRTDAWSDSRSVRLPRAVGDLQSWVEVREVENEFRIIVRWEQ